MSSCFYSDAYNISTSTPCDFSKYRNFIGSVIFLSSRTRPDISISVSILAQNNQHPTEYTWKTANRVLRYLKATRTEGLHYRLDASKELQAYCNFDFAADTINRKSRSGYALHYGGCFLDWFSKKRSTCSQSTAEAEH